MKTRTAKHQTRFTETAQPTEEPHWCRSEAFESSLPRSMEGEGLQIVEVGADGTVLISDGARTAPYIPLSGEPLRGTELCIVLNDTEAGYFMQANLVMLTDGERPVRYVPLGHCEHPC